MKFLWTQAALLWEAEWRDLPKTCATQGCGRKPMWRFFGEFFRGGSKYVCDGCAAILAERCRTAEAAGEPLMEQG